MERRAKKQKRCQAAERAEAGDLWDHTEMAADSKLIVSLGVGKRTQAQTTALVHDAKKRLRPRHLPAIFTDAYEGAMSRPSSKPLDGRYPAPNHSATGQSRRPLLRWPQGLAYGQVKKQSKGRGIERVDVRVVHGKARLQHVLYLVAHLPPSARNILK
jgi:hypothetical protein